MRGCQITHTDTTHSYGLRREPGSLGSPNNNEITKHHSTSLTECRRYRSETRRIYQTGVITLLYARGTSGCRSINRMQCRMESHRTRSLPPPNKQNFGGKMRTGQSRTTGKRNTLPPICEAAHALLSPTNCRTGLSVQVMIRWA